MTTREPVALGAPTTHRPWVGISGWSYPPWRGVFYPPKLRQASELAYASRQFASIEVNGSFYSLMRPTSCQHWYDQTPEGFVFSVKGSRFITHMKRLKDIDVPLANFFASGILRLGEKLGPILWQLPPAQTFDAPRLQAFFRVLPRTLQEAARLARGHDQRLNGRSETSVRVDGPLRYALEVRHPSFISKDFVALLREHGIACCVADTAGLYPLIEDVTTDFSYVRLHGAERLYVSGYRPKELEAWSARVKAWLRGRTPETSQLLAEADPRFKAGGDVFVYFDNDVKVRAPFDAANLQRLINGERPRRFPKTAPITEEPRTSWPAWEGITPVRRKARS